MMMLVAATASAQGMDALSFEEWRGADRSEHHTVTLNAWHGKPVIVLFWRIDCMPCQLELQQLPDIAAQQADSTILLVSLTADEKARERIAATKLPTNVHVLMSSADGETVLAVFGNARKILPFSAALHKDGSVCQRHHGLLGGDTVSEWVRVCKN